MIANTSLEHDRQNDFQLPMLMALSLSEHLLSLNTMSVHTMVCFVFIIIECSRSFYMEQAIALSFRWNLDLVRSNNYTYQAVIRQFLWKNRVKDSSIFSPEQLFIVFDIFIHSLDSCTWFRAYRNVYKFNHIINTGLSYSWTSLKNKKW